MALTDSASMDVVQSGCGQAKHSTKHPLNAAELHRLRPQLLPPSADWTVSHTSKHRS